jgi:hypothetical protein
MNYINLKQLDLKPRNLSSAGLEILIKYQIQELFWEENNVSETTKYRNRVCSALGRMN